MNDSFKINVFASISLILISIGFLISAYNPSTLGFGLRIFGFAGLMIFGGLDKYISFSFVIWIIGLQFIISHWPYGRLIVLIGGLLLFISLFFNFKRDGFAGFKLWIWISLLFLFATYFLKLIDIGGFDFNLYSFMAAAVALIVTYTMRFFSKKNKIIEDYLKLAFVYSWMTFFVFERGHFPYQALIAWIMVIATLCLGCYSLIDKLILKTTANN